MDPQMRFGSGSPLLGGTSDLQAAAQRRGIDASVLNQVGGGSPIAQPMPQPSNTQMPQAPQSQAPNPFGTGSDEANLIITALSNRLKSDSKIKEAQSIPQKPPSQVAQL